MRWLALHFPRLPLDALAPVTAPAAVVDAERILVADPAAAAAGVRPGMRVADARGLLPALSTPERSPAREAAVLHQLACWAAAFSPRVSLLPPAGLLLDLDGCLRLFGGADALRQRLRAEAAGQGMDVRLALAGTPLAAQCLAAAGESATADWRAALAALPTALPCAILGLPAAVAERLAACGLARLGDLRGLPAADLARRFGAAFAEGLGRLYGTCPDPRPVLDFPETFAASLELPARVETVEALSFATRRLVGALCGWLAVRASGVMACTLRLAHERGEASELVLRFTQATRDAARIGRVLSEHLARLRLPAPVYALTLSAPCPEPLPGRNGSLFSGGEDGGEGIAALVERLRARLGEQAVHGLAAAAAHRPECATLPVAAPGMAGAGRSRSRPAVAAAAGAGGAAARPLWLLTEPEALPERDGGPWREGRLALLRGPERIESGWWDAGDPGAPGDVRRDYFVARTVRDELLWVFRDARGWFLHGIFA